MQLLGRATLLALLLTSSSVQANASTQEVGTLAKYIVKVNKKVPTDMAHQMASIIVEESGHSEIEVGLIVGIIQAESTFKVNARSTEGAVGLMQVHKKSHKDKKTSGVRNNIKSGISILKDKIGDSTSLKGALRKYSGGSTSYHKKVLGYRAQYKQFKQFKQKG